MWNIKCKFRVKFLKELELSKTVVKFIVFIIDTIIQQHLQHNSVFK